MTSMSDEIGGAIWADPEAWTARLEPGGCPVCQRGEPEHVLVELPRSWVVAPPRAPVPGYVAVFAKTHAVEPYDLAPTERIAFWEEALMVARALSDLIRPIKTNYEIHGNTVPHLHMHLFPRSRDDPHVGGPIDARKNPYLRSREDLGRIRDAVRLAMEAGVTAADRRPSRVPRGPAR
jgi:diadenosine tetraphosphate (Ap4A) HIT family hydrolase